MLGAIAGYVIVVLFSSALAMRTKKRIELMFPIVAAIITAVFYICGILGILKFGGLIVLATAVLTAGYLVNGIIKDKEGAKKSVITPGLLLYCAVCIISIFVYLGRKAASWDEFSHWVDIVKVYSLYGKFGCIDTHSEFASYIPGLACFEYFFQNINNLVFKNNFSEWLVFYSYHLFITALVMPVLYKTKWKEITSWLLSVLVFFFPSIVFVSVNMYALIDPIIGILSGFGLAMTVYCEEKGNIEKAMIISYAFLLTLSKSAGILFAVFIVLCMAMEEIFDKNKKWYICGSIGVATVFVSKISWTLYVKVADIVKVFSNKIDIKELAKVILGRDNSYRTEVYQIFYPNFKYSKIDFSGIALSYPYAFLIPLVIIGILGFAYYKKKNKEKQVVALAIMTLLQSFLYIFGTMVSYMFKFTEEEAKSLASFTRYMGVGIAVPILILLILIFDVLIENKKSWGYAVLFAVFIIAVQPKDLKSIYENNEIMREEYDSFSEEIKSVAADNNVFIISESGNGFDFEVLKFLLRPSLTNEYQNSINFNESVSFEVFDGYDYVAVYHTNEYLSSGNCPLFENGAANERTIYFVDHDRKLLVPSSGTVLM